MSVMTSHITGVSFVCSTVCSGPDKIKHHSSASLAFAREIHRRPVDSPHKGPVTRKYFHLMTSSCIIVYHVLNLTLQWLPLHVHSSHQARATYMMVSMQAINSCHYRASSNTSRRDDMMTSSNGNIFRVTGHLCGEFTGPRWILHTKASDAELWFLLWSAPE